MKKTLLKGMVAVSLLAAAVNTAHGSSHREALAVLNEPCADNTDTYAWVSNGTHDKLYLIMDFNPLHEPGQGNQGLRACNGYRYEFHIGKGTSLKDEVVYRVEFKNTLDPGERTQPDGPARRRQRTALAAHRRHRDHDRHARRAGSDDQNGEGDVIARQGSAGAAQQSRTADRPAGLRPRRRSRATTPAIPPAVKSVSTTRLSSTSYIQPLSNGGRIIAGQFDDPYQLDEKGIFDLVNSSTDDLGGIPGARAHARQGRLHGLQHLLDRPRSSDRRRLPRGIPHNGAAQGELDRQPAARLGQHQPPGRCRPSMPPTSSPVSRAPATGCRSAATRCRSSTPAWSARSGRRCTCTPARMNDVTQLRRRHPVSRCWCATPRRSASIRRWAFPTATVATLKGPRLDIINAINLGRPIPVADGSTGDVITLDAAIDSQLPQRPPPRRRDGAEPQSGERQQRADQPDRRGRSRRPGSPRASR